ncbi:MAG TPA: D-alanine--D-alanine ligase [Candidatus Paceibacterota bacterium]|nr:D-alanine--D-alanine ligase [Candidatus Paceibacterota bacterium]
MAVTANRKLKIGVLMGGPSAEHEVSLSTGDNVVANLDKAKYKPVVIKLSKNKKWFVNGRLTTLPKAMKSCDIIFNALHGTFGEDGRVQALLEYHDARYTGSGITASALAMDKLRSREIFKLAGFCVPKTLKIKKGENYQARLNLFITKITKLPVVVKPCSNGSSVGVKIISDESKLIKAIDETFKLDKKILVEEFIKGREVTCGVLDNFNGQETAALPVTEIAPAKKHKFYDYDAKYKDGHTAFTTPAQIDETTYNKAQEVAVRAHQLLGCRGYSRTDMILRNDNIYVLETNTLPGLTSHSLVPQAAKVSGLTFGQLLDKIIENSLA